MSEASRLVAGRYEVGELLGRGGMADVYRGTDTRLGRTVAIKLLRPALATDPTFRSRFRQEAQSAARMAHPTIVRVFDAGEETIQEPDGTETQAPFIVMEYVKGRMLKDIVDAGPLEVAEAARISAGILTALEYSHRAGVVHRDIKPGNVMITDPGQVKVMDFGIARAISEAAATVAQTTALLGTASYFSPEQARGETVDARSDLYSAGVVLFEMLTGRPPFRGDTPVAVAYQHLSETPVAPSSINPKVSPAMDEVVLRALAKDRFGRYQSAAEFRDDVETAGAGHVPAHKPRDSFSDTLFGPPAVPEGGSAAALRQLSDDTTMVRTQNRPPVVWIWAGILCVAVIIFAVVFWAFSLSPGGQLPDSSRAVPNLTGKTYQQARSLLKKDNLSAKKISEASATIDPGSVVRTDPPASTTTAPGTVIDVYVSTGKKKSAVPNVRTMKLADAQAALAKAGFAQGQVSKQNSPTVPSGIVISSSPEANSFAHEGDRVNLAVSSGLVTLPNLVGQTIKEAQKILTGRDLQLTGDPKPDGGCPTASSVPVHSQSLPPGDVPQGSKVTLTYCTG